MYASLSIVPLGGTLIHLHVALDFHARVRLINYIRKEVRDLLI